MRTKQLDITVSLRETTIAEQNEDNVNLDHDENEKENEKEDVRPNQSKRWGAPRKDNLEGLREATENDESQKRKIASTTLGANSNYRDGRHDNEDDSQSDMKAFYRHLGATYQPSPPACAPPNDIGPNIDYDPVLTIGNVQLHTSGAGNDITAPVRSSTHHDELGISLDEFALESDEDADADHIRQLNEQGFAVMSRICQKNFPVRLMKMRVLRLIMCLLD